MIEFDDGPTDEQVRELFQETTVLLTMLTHADLHDDEECARQANATFATSPAYALTVLASIGAGRYWRWQQHHEGDPGGPQFPREVLQTVPSDGRPDLLLLAIDLLEAVARRGRVRPLVDQLLVDGVHAYRVLLAVVHEMGWLAARADPAIATVVDLVAVEAVTAEQDWYAKELERPQAP